MIENEVKQLVMLGGLPAWYMMFFLSGCCMAQRRSLSGRSPFCQLCKGLQKTSVYDELDISITLQVND